MPHPFLEDLHQQTGTSPDRPPVKSASSIMRKESPPAACRAMICNMCKNVLENDDDFKRHHQTKYGQEACQILRSMQP